MADEVGAGGRALFYLEVPPPLFGRIAQGIATAGRADGARVMVEKPFGTDLRSAQELNATMNEVFPEDAIYRVDHWLGLDPLENVLFARFANSVIEPLLNRDHVESIQITMAEAFDVVRPGQLLRPHRRHPRRPAEPHAPGAGQRDRRPAGPSGHDAWRAQKAEVISSLRPLTPDDTVRGQYDGYLDVAGVAPGSTHRDATSRSGSRSTPGAGRACRS